MNRRVPSSRGGAIRTRLIALTAGVAALSTSAAYAQASQKATRPPREAARTAQQTTAAKPGGGMRDFSLVATPIPISNPAVGNGLAVAALGLYKVGDSQRPWTTALGGLYTDTKTWAAVVGQKAYLGGDRFRLTAGVGGGVFKTEFFGIGQNAGRRGVSAPIKERGKGGLVEFLVRVAPNLYVGPEFRYLDLDISLDLSNTRFADQQIPERELNSKVAAVGVAAEYDTRDNEFGPTKGIYATGIWLRASERLGGSFDFDRVEAAVNGYHALDPKSVLAWRASVCWTGGGAPFYQLCSFGQSSDLRGYQSGQYIDHAMYAVQAEYRRHLFWRIGATAFVGVGEVADSFYDLNSRNLLPAAGVGLRFKASEAYGVNVRVDVAKGKGSEGFYVSVGEAF